ncbi:MAG: carbon monoxide dehydrogenase [Rhodospirillaceae bacterium]|nr:carbon monoxide dehydrogenase [Rhodospirillaceae bacterium]|tara:strand:- start:20719 stop:23061 length:2343 start_codon:yes stop_codon:yes gene_type:complete
MGEFGIGQSVPREEDPRLLTGGGDFLDDVNLLNQAFGYVLRSPHAHASILSIDISAARASKGVIKILTGKDWMEENFGTMPCEDTNFAKRADGSAMFHPYRGALVTDRVRFVGDYVAFVIAETKLQARDAAELIAVKYKIHPAITSIDDATTHGAEPVWPENPDNIAFTLEKGDENQVDKAFKKADRVITHNFVINRVTAVTMEPRGCIGDFDRRTDRFTLYTGLQNPHPVRQQLTQGVFKIPETQMRVVPGDVGGSFGMRGGTYPELALVLWAAKIISRPVKWTCDRSEGFMSDDHGRDNLSKVSLAVDKNGYFLGLKVETFASMGAYLAIRGPRPPTNNLGTLAGVYRTPAAFVRVSGVFTNMNCTNPYRGSGAPEAAYNIERMVDIVANELNMDPAKLRAINCVTPDQMPWTNALGFHYDCGDFPGNQAKALKAINYDDFKMRRALSKTKGKLRGIGISNTVKKTSSPFPESCKLRFDPSGTLTMIMGTISHGQGHETIFKQIVCDKLGLEPSIIRYVQGDTDIASYGRGTFNSRSTAIGGSAAALACQKTIEKGKRIASHLMETAEQDIIFSKGYFTVSGTDRSLKLIELAKKSFQANELPPDIEPGLDEQGSFKPEYWNWPTGVQICEVEIDPETGETEILNFVCVDDVGTVINPLLLKAQMHGGIAQGIGQALMEEVKFDSETGQLLSGSLMDYCMPRADDFCFMDIISSPTYTRSNLIGAKGGGESGPTGALPATINAVVDALQELGIYHLDMPATPHRIWKAIQNARSKKAA